MSAIYFFVFFVSLFVLAVFWSFKAEKKRDQLFMAMSAKNDFESISNYEALNILAVSESKILNVGMNHRVKRAMIKRGDSFSLLICEVRYQTRTGKNNNCQDETICAVMHNEPLPHFSVRAVNPLDKFMRDSKANKGFLANLVVSITPEYDKNQIDFTDDVHFNEKFVVVSDNTNETTEFLDFDKRKYFVENFIDTLVNRIDFTKNMLALRCNGYIDLKKLPELASKAINIFKSFL